MEVHMHVGDNLGIILAQSAIDKIFDEYDLQGALNQFKYSLGCDDEIATKLLLGEYVITKHETDPGMINVIERKDLPKGLENKYPVFDFDCVIKHLAKLFSTKTDEEYDHAFYGFRMHMSDCVRALMDNRDLSLDSNLSNFLFCEDGIDIEGYIRFKARKLVSVLMKRDKTELREFIEGALENDYNKICLNSDIRKIYNIIFCVDSARRVMDNFDKLNELLDFLAELKKDDVLARHKAQIFKDYLVDIKEFYAPLESFGENPKRCAAESVEAAQKKINKNE